MMHIYIYMCVGDTSCLNSQHQCVNFVSLITEPSKYKDVTDEGKSYDDHDGDY